MRLIDADAVLDGIEELKKSPWATDKRGNGFEYLIAEALDVVADLCVKQAPSVNPQEPKYCDRNICIKNEYNGISCDECEVTKSQEPKTIHGSTYGGVSWGGMYKPQELCGDVISRQIVLDYIYNDLGLGDEENGKDIERQMELESSYKYIKSLPPVTTEPCGDCVNRQAVLEYIEGSEAELGHSSENELVCQYIKELPPVKAEPKTGHWITTRTFMHDGEYYCDKCKCDAPNNEKWDFCPNCGCRMVESQKSEG